MTKISQPTKLSVFGFLALLISIISVPISGIMFMFMPINIMLGSLAVTFGALAHWGPSRDRYGLVGFILGLVAICLCFFWIFSFYYYHLIR